MSSTATLSLRAIDVSGQNRFRVGGVSVEATVGELVDRLLADMRLSTRDANGNPVPYRARLQREGRHLFETELVGSALREDDELMLQPDIAAGT